MRKTTSQTVVGALLASMVLVGIVAAVDIGDINNLIQTIKNVVITSDGSPSGQVIMNINDAAASDDGNRIYVKPGAFRNASIAQEDIDADSLRDSTVFACDPGQIIQSIKNRSVNCVNTSGYWKLTDSQQANGSIAFGGKAAIARSASATDFGREQLLIDQALQTSGRIVVGKSNSSVSIDQDAQGRMIVDMDGPDAGLVVGQTQPVAIGGAVALDASGNPAAKLTVHGNVSHDTALTVGNRQGRAQITVDADSARISTSSDVTFLGHSNVGASSLLTHVGSVAHATNRGVTTVSIGTGTSQLGGSLKVGGTVAVRGTAERGGLRFAGMNSATATVGSLKDTYNCKVASIDTNGNLVLKEIAAESCDGGSATNTCSQSRTQHCRDNQTNTWVDDSLCSGVPETQSQSCSP